MSDVNLNLHPRMVAWFKPTLLYRAAFHHTVAGIFGQYADQRTIQQLEDPIPRDQADQGRFVTRYDYSSEGEKGEPFWVDFASDLGDGFDSTYAVAYLLAAGALSGRSNPDRPKIATVSGLAPDEELSHGRVLIMGGDQVYPWPSRDAYANRLQKPYALAYPPPHIDPATRQRVPTSRDVFAIPGNHDWYDGLGSFDDLFCRARGGRPEHELETVGGWQTRQHRSYFALKLPYNWWIWGADIQLSQHLDPGQLRYFNKIASEMGPNDKFVLCTAQPTWLYFGTPSERYARESLRSLIDLPIRRGAKLCAIFSGDTHHYSRYVEDDQLGNFNLFTSGGGGAYVHGTHQLNDTIAFEWIGRNLAFRLNKRLKRKTSEEGRSSPPEKTGARACYPNRVQSCWRAATNIAFPIRNFGFAMAMGLVYWLVTWSLFETSIYPDVELEVSQKVIQQSESKDRQLQERMERRFPDLKQFRLQRRGFPPSETDGSNFRDSEAGAPQDDKLIIARPIRYWTLEGIKLYLDESKNLSLWQLTLYSGYLLVSGLASSPSATVFVFFVWAVFYLISDSKRKGASRLVSRFISGTLHFLLHLFVMWGLYSYFTYLNFIKLLPILEQWAQTISSDDKILLLLPVEIWATMAYIPEMILFGGVMAGLIFGIYLAITYIFGRINTDWAFSAQSSPDYRNFLRFRFDPDRLTVYPIGLDSPPRHRRWWASGRPSGWVVVNGPVNGAPRVEPRTPLRPHLIEGPIVINANEVMNIPRDAAR